MAACLDGRWHSRWCASYEVAATATCEGSGHLRRIKSQDIGKRKVSISQGLKAGATVVLADLDVAVPTSTTNNRGFGGNGLGGGGPVVVQRDR